MTLEQRLAQLFVGSHPVEAARALERMPAALRAMAIEDAPAATAATIMRTLSAPLAAECLARMKTEGAAAALDALEPTAAAALLRRLSAERAAAIVDALPAAGRERMRRALRYPEATAGALADPAVVSIPVDVSAAEARLALRRAPGLSLEYVYVVDRDQRLVGAIDIPELLRSRAHDEVRALMHAPVESLPAAAPAAVIRTHPAWRLYHAMPVVDEDGRLVGAVGYRTLRRLEHDARAVAPSPASVTAAALGELFHLGMAGLVEGIAAAAPHTAGRLAEAAPHDSRTGESA